MSREKKSPGWHRGERCYVNRRRNDNPEQSVKAIPSANELPPTLKGIPVTPIEPRDLPSIASEPIQINVSCPRCGYEITRQTRQEYTRIPDGFRPFYERALKGELQALVEYYKESWHRDDLGSAFYQCLGYFAAKSFPQHVKIVESVLRINKTGRGTFNQRPAKLAVYRNWNETYRRSAKGIRKWLKAKRRKLDTEGLVLTRQELWRAYTKDNLPELDEADVGKDDYHRGLRELFRLLAQSNPRLTPSIAARAVACRIAGISQSSVSHKNVGK